MSIDELAVLLFSLGGIIFTFWFFLMKKETEVIVKNNSVDIIVDGGYNPSFITVPHREKTTLTFLRKDASSCLEEVVLSDFKVRTYLPLNKKVSLTITPTKKGEFQFSCGMNMFHGKIKVV